MGNYSMISHSIFKEYSLINASQSCSAVTLGCLGNKSNVFMLSEKQKLGHIVSLWKVTRDTPVITINPKSEVSCIKFSMDDKAA